MRMSLWLRAEPGVQPARPSMQASGARLAALGSHICPCGTTRDPGKTLEVLVQNLHLHVCGPGKPYAESSKAQPQVAALPEVEVLKRHRAICGWQSHDRPLSRCG